MGVFRGGPGYQAFPWKPMGPELCKICCRLDVAQDCLHTKLHTPSERIKENSLLTV